MRCPHCDSFFVQEKPPLGLRDRLARLFFLYPYQCLSCTHRFPCFVSPREHRRGYRIPVRIPVRFELAGGRGEGILTDVSVGGCALESADALTPGRTLTLRLLGRSQETDRAQDEVVVTVRWVYGNRAGMQFIAPTPQEEQRIVHVISGHLDRAR